MNAHDYDKATALLKSLAAECSSGRDTRDAEHAWRTCRHCLAVEELDHRGVRALLREFLAQLADTRTGGPV